MDTRKTVVNVREAKAQFSRLLERAHRGETIILAKGGKPYARLVPLEKLDPQTVMQEQGRSGDRPLYFICQMGGRSGRACAMLMALGYKNVVNVEGGTDAWIAAGLPVESGDGPVPRADTVCAIPAGHSSISIERQIKITHGSLIVLSLALGAVVHHWWYALAAVVGAGQIATGLTDLCGTRAFLANMPWNR